MSDPGLSHRLRQRSRRAGLMIGFSMILTIALCAVGFTVIYTALDNFTADFVSGSDERATEPDIAAAQTNNQPNAAATEPPQAAGNAGQNEAQQQAEPTEPEPTATLDEDAFDPDYQNGNVTVNLRAGPSTADSIVDTVPPAAPLQYSNEDAPTTSPSDGDRWMKFRTEDGAEGWIREIDVTPFQP